MQQFKDRHIGLSKDDINKMLNKIKCNSVDNLIKKTLPKNILNTEKLKISRTESEYTFLNELKKIEKLNKVFKSHIGQGYYETITPSVIKRNILENPSWYTAYTPYQAEISQGRLEALINFQTMVCDLTKMEIANASLLDEATAAAEAMIMLYNTRKKDQIKNKCNHFFISEKCFPQTINVLKTRAKYLNIKLTIGDESKFNFQDKFFGMIIQQITKNGEILDIEKTLRKNQNTKVVVAADIMSLAIIEPPGEFEIDVVVGSTQRFGVPMGYGGPHAAFFATKSEYKRNIPGRIIGITKDKLEDKAYRMALQTREQHIRREKATSNICTSQVLLAVMAGMYAVYHGEQGIKSIASKINILTKLLKQNIDKKYKILNKSFFDTLYLKCENLRELKKKAKNKKINFNYINKDEFSITINETDRVDDVIKIIQVLDEVKKIDKQKIESIYRKIKPNITRKSSFLQNKVFKQNQSETQMMRYIKSLEVKDISLTESMIPLGSCTMKLNAASELEPISWEGFANIHPYAPKNQCLGYEKIIKDISKYLCEITGLDSISLQPNSGAQGEYTGLIVIRKYLDNNNGKERNICLIPSSAHGTNPASAVMAGFDVKIVKCNEYGDIDYNDIKEKVKKYKNNLGALMITYPSTHGVFEHKIQKITKLIHENGGQVYMDGANMNAQVGITSPKKIGADVCHLNLHKTFAIPHGGGGPGMGPICVEQHLSNYLPNHSIIKVGGKKGTGSVSQAPWGSALILLISYAYIKLLGEEGLTKSTKYAILSANYMKKVLEKDFKILFQGKTKTVAHEFIIDFREYKQYGIEVVDIAKRLLDYSFHAPTVSFPVSGTIMIEPTESENLNELNRFCDAMKNIKYEIQEIIDGKYDKTNNVLKNSPHNLKMLTADLWNMPYSREKAAYPMKILKENKKWPYSSRINDALGDKNLICSCNDLI